MNRDISVESFQRGFEGFDVHIKIEERKYQKFLKYCQFRGTSIEDFLTPMISSIINDAVENDEEAEKAWKDFLNEWIETYGLGQEISVHHKLKEIADKHSLFDFEYCLSEKISNYANDYQLTAIIRKKLGRPDNPYGYHVDLEESDETSNSVYVCLKRRS